MCDKVKSSDYVTFCPKKKCFSDSIFHYTLKKNLPVFKSFYVVHFWFYSFLFFYILVKGDYSLILNSPCKSQTSNVCPNGSVSLKPCYFSPEAGFRNAMYFSDDSSSISFYVKLFSGSSNTYNLLWV